MLRTKEVKIADKIVIVSEKKVCELEEMFAQVFKSNIKIDANGTVAVGELKTAVVSTFFNSISFIAPELTEADVKNAYPSELEALVGGFIDVNFTGLKQVYAPLSTLLRAALAPKLRS